MRIPEDVRFVTVKNRGNVSAMLNWTIAAECKKCAQGQFADSTFAKDLKRMQGSLKVGGVVLSADFDAARNQIAAFVSKGARTTYGELSGAEKGKAHIVMALLSQETAKAAFDGQFTALDKKNTMILDPQSVYKVTVSPEGTTATVTLSSIGQMVVGTEGDTMESHFGSVVVEREYTRRQRGRGGK